MADVSKLNVKVSWVIRRLQEYVEEYGDQKVLEMTLITQENNLTKRHLTYTPHQKGVVVKG